MGGEGTPKSKTTLALQRAAKSLSDNSVVPVLLASVTALAALLAMFGGADSAQRNHQYYLLGSVALVCAALLLGGLAALHDQKYLATVGVFALVVGLLLAAWAAVDHHSGQPQISASLITSPQQHIEATIERDGLAAKDQMEATVEGYPNENGKVEAGHPPVVLYRASFGPDQSGKAALNFQVPVPQERKAIKSILLRTWVASSDHKPPDLSCSTGGSKSSGDTKHWAACVLIVLR